MSFTDPERWSWDAVGDAWDACAEARRVEDALALKVAYVAGYYGVDPAPLWSLR